MSNKSDIGRLDNQTSTKSSISFYDLPIAASIESFDGSNSDVDYCFSEGAYLDELKSYIDKTYGQHYAKSKIQSTEFIMDTGHGEGFCIGNIIKYAQRYGKKGGKNRADLLKVCHYSIMMLHVHDHFNIEEK